MEQVLINKRSRENAEKTRQSIKTNLQQKTDMANRVQKFIDCRSKDKGRREVYIVEGDSAAGAIRTSRDAEFQGVMPVRGKILNCLKEDYPRIFKSEIIMDLLRVLGCGVEVNDTPHEEPGHLRPGQPELEQGHHLHRRRRRRLPYSHAHLGHALSPGAHAHPTRGSSTSPNRRCTRSTARRRPTSLTPISRRTTS